MIVITTGAAAGTGVGIGMTIGMIAAGIAIERVAK